MHSLELFDSGTIYIEGEVWNLRELVVTTAGPDLVRILVHRLDVTFERHKGRPFTRACVILNSSKAKGSVNFNADLTTLQDEWSAEISARPFRYY